MKTYTVLLAQDVPHYGATEIEAESAARALERAKSIDIADIWLDPDWENPVCSRIVHIADEAGASIAHDVALDGYVLHHSSERIRIFIRGGLVQGAEASDGRPIRVDVIDYDIDTCDPQELAVDRNDDPCRRYTA